MNYDQKQIFLNSKYASKYLNGTKKSHCVFHFEESVNYFAYEDVYMSIDHCIFPISFYIINENNNSFIFNNVTYNISEGNYGIQTLITEIKSYISNLEIAFDSKINKLTFTYNNNFTINGNILNILGFSNQEHLSINNSLTSDNVIDLSGNNIIYILIDEISNQNMNSYNKLKGNTLVSIPLDVNHGDILLYSNTNQLRNKVSLLSYKKFTINILDEDFNYIDFQNKDWYITLLFQSSVDLKEKKRYMLFQNLLSNFNNIYQNNNNNNNT